MIRKLKNTHQPHSSDRLEKLASTSMYLPPTLLFRASVGGLSHSTQSSFLATFGSFLSLLAEMLVGSVPGLRSFKGVPPTLSTLNDFGSFDFATSLLAAMTFALQSGTRTLVVHRTPSYCGMPVTLYPAAITSRDRGLSRSFGSEPSPHPANSSNDTPSDTGRRFIYSPFGIE